MRGDRRKEGLFWLKVWGGYNSSWRQRHSGHWAWGDCHIVLWLWSKERWMLLLYQVSLFSSAKEPRAWCHPHLGHLPSQHPLWDHPYRHTQRCASLMPQVLFILTTQQLKLAITLKHYLIWPLALGFDSGAVVVWAENPGFTVCSSLGSHSGSLWRWEQAVVFLKVTFLSSCLQRRKYNSLLSGVL